MEAVKLQEDDARLDQDGEEHRPLAPDVVDHEEREEHGCEGLSFLSIF